MHGYIGFFNGQKVEIHADSLYQAKQKAVAHFGVKPNKAHLVSVVLAEKNGEPVTHTPDF